MSETREDRWTGRLSEYLDGEVTSRERAELEAHLEGCASCRAVLDELRGVVARAQALDDPPPEVDLWPGIERRLDAHPARAWTRLASWLAAPRFAFSVPQLAAAAVVLVMLSGGGVWLAMRGAADRGAVAANGSVPAASIATPGAVAPPDSESDRSRPSAAIAALGEASGPEGGARLASYDFTRYDATIGELQRVLRENRGDLDTSTVRIIQQNLTLIDHAISDARHALAADPANPYLNGHLAQQLQRKVRLLQRATDLVAAHQS